MTPIARRRRGTVLWRAWTPEPEGLLRPQETMKGKTMRSGA